MKTSVQISAEEQTRQLMVFGLQVMRARGPAARDCWTVLSDKPGALTWSVARRERVCVQLVRAWFAGARYLLRRDAKEKRRHKP
jgi:hypothetical protein